MVVLLESGHDAVSRGEAVAIVSWLERLKNDDIGVYMLCEHDEVISAAGADWELDHVVGVDLSNGIYPNIEFIGIGGGVRWIWNRCFGRSYGLGGSNALSRFFYVTLEGFYGNRAVIGCVGGGEAWPGGVVN